ncbi:MAG: hypothetical protein NE330_06205, partial [Lentisphaeraceae bacterium]|nr:hypothetical protein [Lentisphaeraceae bacterium]
MQNIVFIFLTLFLIELSAETRPYKMGFSTWLYAPTGEAINSTQEFLKKHGDLYTEKFDEHVPWKSLLADEDWPAEFQKAIGERAARRLPNKELLLVLTPLKNSHDSLINDVDGSLPTLTYGDQKIIDAYVKYCEKMISLFNPNYLIISIASNELLLKNPPAWKIYEKFSKAVYSKLKKNHRNLLIAESINLNKLINPDSPETTAKKHQREIAKFTRHFDFFPVIFHPHFSAYSTKDQYQNCFDILHKLT